MCPNGAVPGALRSARKWAFDSKWEDFISNMIIDGVTPVKDPWHKGSIDYSIPKAPEGHYLMCIRKIYKGETLDNFHVYRIDGGEGENVFISERNGIHNGDPGTKDLGFIGVGYDVLDELRDDAKPKLGYVSRFEGFYAVPNKGIDLSIQKLICDIANSDAKYLNGFDKEFIDFNFRFCEIVGHLPAEYFKSIEAAQETLNIYTALVSIFKSFVDKSKFDLYRDVDRLKAAYQKTQMAAADRQRVQDYFAQKR